MKTYQDVVKAVLASSPKGTSLRDVLPEASKEWKRIKAGLQPTKGMASLTMKGKKDFTTKKSSKVFHRKGHYERKGPEGKVRRPYRKTSRKGKGKKASSDMLSENVLLIEEQPMAGGASEPTDDAEMKKEQMADEMSEHLERAEETGQGSPNTMENTVQAPGLPTEMGEGQEGGKRRRRGRKHRKSSRRTAKKRGGKRSKKTHRRRKH